MKDPNDGGNSGVERPNKSRVIYLARQNGHSKKPCKLSMLGIRCDNYRLSKNLKQREQRQVQMYLVKFQGGTFKK